MKRPHDVLAGPASEWSYWDSNPEYHHAMVA